MTYSPNLSFKRSKKKGIRMCIFVYIQFQVLPLWNHEKLFMRGKGNFIYKVLLKEETKQCFVLNRSLGTYYIWFAYSMKN